MKTPDVSRLITMLAACLVLAPASLAANESLPITAVIPQTQSVQKWNDMCGDSADPFWANDDNLYHFTCDGRGFGKEPRNLCFNRLDGQDWENLKGVLINPMDEYGKANDTGHDGATWKVCGQQCIDGVFYAFVTRNIYGDKSKDPLMRQTSFNTSLIKSTDGGRTWTRTAKENYTSPMWPGARFGAPGFIHFGRDGGQVKKDLADRFVYVISNNGFWNGGDDYILARVKRADLPRLNAADWSYYQGGDGLLDASWSHEIPHAKPILERPAKLGWTPPVFIPALNRYLLTGWYVSPTLKKWFEPEKVTYEFFESPHPWGPWNLVSSFDDHFMIGGHMYGPGLSAKYQVTRGDEVELSLFTSGCPFEDKPSSLYKMWRIPLRVLTTPPPRFEEINNDHPSVRYSGDWQRIEKPERRYLQDDLHFSTTPGDAVEITFNGPEIEWIAEKFHDLGRAEVFLDGDPRGIVDLKHENFPRFVRTPVFSARALRPGPHTLRIVNRSKSYLVVDAFRVATTGKSAADKTSEPSGIDAGKANWREKSPAAAGRTQWFQEARFGMFIHWGVYAVPAGEWQGKPVGGVGEWIMKNGKIPVADYKGFAKDFTAAKYDPATWAKLAKDAGMRYVVITSKHHDGFALYDSKVTDWDVINSGAKRDLLVPLAKAVRGEGLKFGLYYSQAQDWTHPGGAKYGNKNWDPTQDGDYDSYLKTIALPQTQEIIAAYQPDIIWWDTPVNMTKERAKPFADFLSANPSIITNNRLGVGYDGDTMTPEQHIPPRGYPGKMFEVCMTMNDTWGFKKNDHNWKSTRQILRNLSDISSKGGNFLLNVGPTAEGVIPPESVERLQAVGRWMDVNGGAIYATTASPFPRRLPWGRVTQKRAADGATTLYLHVWDWPADGKLLLPTLQELPTSGKLLKGGAAVTAQHTADGVMIQFPGSATDADVSVIRLNFPGPLTITQQPFVVAAADGSITLLAADADSYGGLSGNMRLAGSGPDAYLTDWKSPEFRLEYQIKTHKPGKWMVEAEVATPHPAKITLNVKKVSIPAEIPATGPDLTWKTFQLGTIDLPAGESTLEVKAVKDGWKGLNPRRIKLVPMVSE